MNRRLFLAALLIVLAAMLTMAIISALWPVAERGTTSTPREGLCHLI